MNSIEEALQHHLLNARNIDGAWGYESGRKSRLEPTCWALLALGASRPEFDQVLSDWPARGGALVEHRGGLENWSFHALALTARLAMGLASVRELQPLAEALVQARGLAVQPSPIQRQDNRLQGWSWIEGTFSWGEPTAWALLALKKCRTHGLASRTGDIRIRDGEAILQDRVCVKGGWNYGNSNVFGKNLPAYIPTTAIALLALQDRKDETFVRHSLNFLEEHAGNHASTRALALSMLALRRYGRSAVLVEEALRTWLASHPPTDVVSMAMAACALEGSAADDPFAF